MKINLLEVAAMSDVCRCAQQNMALWSYCPDDYFCPQCGAAITRLISKNRFPPEADSGPIWVYAQKGQDVGKPLFAFPLAVKYSNQSREVQRRKPAIDFEQSKLEGNQFFSPTLQPAESGNPVADHLSNRPFRVQLIPLGNTDLPSEGVCLRIPRLVGDFFHAEPLELRVGNKPSLRIELTGPGLEPSKDGGNLVRLTEASELIVELKIHAEHAPVLIKKTLDNESVHCAPEAGDFAVAQGTVSLRLANELGEGTPIIPGHPWSTSATLFAAALTTPGQKVTISFNVDVLVASIDQSQLSLTVERVEKGGAEFDPSPFAIEAMYLGECRSNALKNRLENPEDPERPGYRPVIRRLSIRNIGRERIVLNSLAARHDHPFDWLSVRWATDVSPGAVSPQHDQLELEPFERGEITVRVDLREVRLDQLPPSRSLSAVIQARQAAQDELYEVRLTIQKVIDRIPCPAPLCVDFGNTSSFASIKWHRDFPDHWAAAIGIADVHELRLPESFPTALFFKEAAKNPFESKYEIGNLAITEADKIPARNGIEGLVTDLKRWIGDPRHTKSVKDPHGNWQQYLVSELIVLFLKRLIERAEHILRKYTIQQVCVSHPSKFDAIRRQAFHGLIDRLCELVTQERPARPLVRVIADVDEANAVAVGALFEPEMRREFLRELFQKPEKSFVVACFDLGGGSLDTAVIRFQVAGNFLSPRFSSEYLGIGGHSGFGGDNVTLAFLECLLDRIRNCLEHQGLPADACLKCVPSPIQKDSCDQSFMWRNYQILWEIAERVKIHQCRQEHRSANENDSEAHAEREALTSFVQTRLINDVILIPRLEGRIQPDPAVTDALRKLMEERSFLIPLADVYAHEIQNDLSKNQQRTTTRYSVQKRIEEALTELETLATNRGRIVDVVILAGAGSRLPLVSELARTKFPQARIVQDPSRTKFRVAHGLVRFLGASEGGHRFACSSDYSTFAYEVGRRDDGSILLPAIPNCAPLTTPDNWYRVRVPAEWNTDGDGSGRDAQLQDIITHDGSRRVHLFRVEEGRELTLQGWFDLSQRPLPHANAADQLAIPLAADEVESAELTVDLRLVGSEREMVLRVNAPTGSRGVWKLTPVSDESTP